MNTYAVITNGVVTNTIVWDGVQALAPGLVVVNVTGITPQPYTGWTYANGTFTAPA